MPAIGSLTSHLSSYLLAPVCTPRGLDVPFTDVVIYDPIDMPDVSPGDLVLGVGVAAVSDAEPLLRTLGATQASGLVVKIPSPGPELIAAAERASVALFSIPMRASWVHLLTLLRSFLARSFIQTRIQPFVGTQANDLFELANAVAMVVDAPVMIEDTQSRVIAYSQGQEDADESRIQTILARRVPDSLVRQLHEDGVFRRLAATHEPVYFEAGETAVMPRVAIALRTGDEILGWMWAAVNRPFCLEQQRAFADAGTLVAVRLLRQRLENDLNQRLRADLMSTILDAASGADQAAERVGLRGTSYRVMAARVKSSDGTDEAVHIQLANQLELYLSAFSRQNYLTAIAGTVYAVIPRAGQGETERRQIIDLANGFINRVTPRLQCSTLVGIGSRVSELVDIPRSRAEADEALRVLQADAWHGPAAEIEDVRMQTLLLRLREVTTDRHVVYGGRLGLLLQYDATHGTSYVDSLRAYLHSFGDTTDAAQRLHVHDNTLRYRIRKLQQIADIRLDDSEERLALMLQLHLLDGEAS